MILRRSGHGNEIIMLLRTIPMSKLIQPIMQLFIDNAILNNVQNDALLIEKATHARNHLHVYGHCKVIVIFRPPNVTLLNMNTFFQLKIAIRN